MNATAHKGVWSQEISVKTTMIVDTNRNQIIKRTNGVAKEVCNYPSEPTVSMINIMARAMEVSEKITEDYQAALEKFKYKTNEESK